MPKRRPSGDGSIRKRGDGRWEGRIVVGHKENGNPIFRYIYAGTQKELTAKLRQNIEIYQGADLKEQCRMVLTEWLDQWLEQMSLTLRPDTLERYRHNMKNHVTPYLGQKRLNQITAANLRKLYDTLAQNGRMNPRPGQDPGLSGATVHGIHTTLHHALRAAVEQRLLPSNPADEVEPPKISHSPMSILNEEQLDRFMEAIKSDPIWHDFFYTELTTGMRRGEICALQWGDLNFRTGALRVERQVHRVRGELVVSPPKTNVSNRSVILPPSVLSVLKEYRKASTSRWMFPSPVAEGAPRDPAAVRKRLQTVLERAECRKIRFHDLRHTFSTVCLEHGMDVKTLSTIIGHVSSSTTLNVYAHVTDEMRRTAAVKIDREIGKAEPQGEPEATPQKPAPSAFQARKGQRRKAGTGCVSQINEKLWEGRYSPIWPDGRKYARNVYAHTEEQCETLLKELIIETNAELAKAKQLAAEGRLSEAAMLALAMTRRQKTHAPNTN